MKMKRRIWLLAAVLSLALVGVSRAGDEMIESEGGGSNLTPEMQQFVEPIQFTFEHFTDREYSSLEPEDYEPLISVLRERDGGGLTAAEFIKMNDFERHSLLEKTLPKMRSRIQSEATLHAAWLEGKMNDPKTLEEALKATERRKELMKVWRVEVPADFKKAYNKAQSRLADYEIDATRKALGVDEALASLRAEPVAAASASAGQSKDEAKAQKLIKNFDMNKVGEMAWTIRQNTGMVGGGNALGIMIGTVEKALKLDERGQHVVLNGLVRYIKEIRNSQTVSHADAVLASEKMTAYLYWLADESSHESVLRSVIQAALTDPEIGAFGARRQQSASLRNFWIDNLASKILHGGKRLSTETKAILEAYFLDQAKKEDNLMDKKQLIGIARMMEQAPAAVEASNVPPPTLKQKLAIKLLGKELASRYARYGGGDVSVVTIILVAFGSLLLTIGRRIFNNDNAK